MSGAVPISYAGATLRLPVPVPRPVAAIQLRTGRADDAAAIHALIAGHLAEGHLLARELEELQIHAHRFIVATQGPDVVACGELAPLSRAVAEVRSLVVDRTARHGGIGARIVAELRRRAGVEGFRKLCAFTHQPRYFFRMGFSIVPHQWLPEKIATDCHACPLFRQCGQYAVLQTLETGRDRFVPLASLGIAP